MSCFLSFFCNRFSYHLIDLFVEDVGGGQMVNLSNVCGVGETDSRGKASNTSHCQC